MFFFHTPLKKNQKTRDFLKFLGGIERTLCLEARHTTCYFLTVVTPWTQDVN